MSEASAALQLAIPNVCTPTARLCTGGQPAAGQLHDAKQQGVRTVINLRPHTEPCDFDEPALVASLGMTYINIPVASPADLTRANAIRLAEALATAGDSPTLVHCASGNRVGALFALKAHWLDERGIEESLQIGRGTGLRAMEPMVRQLLNG